MTHVDDLVELYALGSLDEFERRRVDAHVTTCADCAHRLSEAETAVAYAIEADPQYEPSLALRERIAASLDRDTAKVRAPSRWMPRAAIAAAFVAVAIPAGFATRDVMTMRQTVASDTMMLEKMAGERLASAQFVPMRGAAPAAHVMYAKRGDFYAVVVANPTRPLQVAYVHPDGTMETIGRTVVRGSMAVAVMPIDHKMPLLALVDGSTVLAEARLAFN